MFFNVTMLLEYIFQYYVVISIFILFGDSDSYFRRLPIEFIKLLVD